MLYLVGGTTLTVHENKGTRSRDAPLLLALRFVIEGAAGASCRLVRFTRRPLTHLRFQRVSQLNRAPSLTIIGKAPLLTDRESSGHNRITRTTRTPVGLSFHSAGYFDYR